MILKLAWAQKQIFWSFENGIFQFFVICWEAKLKPFSPKVRRNVKNYLNQNLVIGSFLQNGFEATLSSKRMFWVFKKDIFQFFANFWVTKLKTFSGKTRQSHLNSKLVIRIVLKNGFEATLRSKANVLSIWKGKFSVFCNF